ncbi:MAG: hypothetical protein NT136_03935 [Candidatus Moranbacteria bacterium]|nr:hypothetical protein [Candidatus Moranbacteria bacterium]
MDPLSILSAVPTIWDFFRRLLKALPKAITSHSLKKFFGKHFFDNKKIYLVLDTYRDSRPRTDNRYYKDYPNRGKGRQPLIGGDIIYGTFAPKFVSLFESKFSDFRKGQFNVVIDEEVDTVMDATLVCYGSSDSNLKTFDIEKEYGGKYYEFVFGNNRRRAFKMKGRIFEFKQGTPAKDRAVLLKIKNPNDKEHSLIVCAGLSEWGSLAAAYYLVNNWRTLYKDYKQKNFCLLFEITYGQFENANVLERITEEDIDK